MFFKLLILFILIPVAELYLFLTLGEEIGIWATLAIIVATAFLGAALTRSQGARAMQRFREAAAQGRMPAKEALDGLLILVAGVVLLTPGFLTDAFGFLLLIPPARVVIRGWLSRKLKGRIHIVPGGVGARPAERDPNPARSRRVDDSDVIDI